MTPKEKCQISEHTHTVNLAQEEFRAASTYTNGHKLLHNNLLELR